MLWEKEKIRGLLKIMMKEIAEDYVRRFLMIIIRGFPMIMPEDI
jgi:hypothetical protein